MTDEIKNVEEKECKCFCSSKGFKKFIVTALGTFVGVFCALSLFAALHKPPMIVPMHSPYGMHRGCPCKMMMHHRGDFGRIEKRGDFQKKFPREAGERAPFEAPAQNTK